MLLLIFVRASTASFPANGSYFIPQDFFCFLFSIPLPSLSLQIKGSRMDAEHSLVTEETTTNVWAPYSVLRTEDFPKEDQYFGNSPAGILSTRY